VSNRHVRELRNVYTALFEDAKYAFPTLAAGLSRDLSRLLRLVDSRGIHVFVVDLPAVGKHLDRCLSTGSYTTSGLCLTRQVSDSVRVPRFLRDLYLQIFDESGNLKEDCNVECVLFLRQILYCAKKATLDCNDQNILDEVQEFLVIDSQLPEPEEVWEADVPTDAEMSSAFTGFSDSALIRDRLGCDPTGLLSTFLVNLDLVSGFISAELGPYRPEDWRFRHGPGAVSERTGSVNKYQFVNWSERLESVYPLADYGFHNHSAWIDWVRDGKGIGSHDPMSRLVAVPKSFLKPRLIAAEPTEHQWCQQNCWHYFCERVKHTWIGDFVRFRDQSKNQRMALEGSGNDRLATVDLSAASDRVTCHVVGNLFRSNIGLLQALRASRTRYLHQQINREVDELVRLRKFSTMGSACTFPVESLVFLAVAIASCLTVRTMRVTAGNIASLSGEVTVFGDDIIVPSDCRVVFERALEVLYFKVNDSKTFWTGKFRESCGVDAFAGVNVTPAYWRSPSDAKPESIASTVEVANNFYKKFMLHTASYLASTVQKADMPTVAVDSGVLGFQSRLGPHLKPLRRRWNRSLQREEVLVTGISARVTKTAIHDDSALLQYFTEDPSPYTMWKGGVSSRPALKIRRRWVPVENLCSQPS